MIKEVLRFEHVTYEEGGIRFLNAINFNVYQREIFGIVCPSDHGKKQLIDLLQYNGTIQQGRMIFNNQVVNTYKRASTRHNKVSLIDRKSHLVDVLSVVDNIFVMRKGYRKQIIKEEVLRKQLQPFIDEINMQISPLDLVENLGVFERLVVELLRAVIQNSKLIIVNEIASFLSQNDLKKYHNLLRYYTRKGFTFIYFCNHHEEAFYICDRLGIMEYGEMIKILNHREFNDEIMKVFSFDFTQLSVYKRDEKETSLFELIDVSCEEINNISFVIHSGECLVILDQNNTTFKSFENLFKQKIQPRSGQMLLNGQSYFMDEENEKKISFIPQYPIDSVLFDSFSVMDNLLIDLKRKIPQLWNQSRTRKSVYQSMKPIFKEVLDQKDISKLDLHVLYQLVYYKVIVYHPRLVIITQPFSYADMYLRQDIINLISQLKRLKIAVIILAVNIADSLFVADHLLLIEEGHSKALYDSSEFVRIRKHLER